MSRQRAQQGYAALLAVLIIGAVCSAIGLALLVAGADSQRTALVSQRSSQARALAGACAEEAMQQIHDNTGYTGTNNLSLGQGSCTYTVTSTGSSTRTVVASGTVGGAKRLIQSSVTIGTSLAVSSWQEVAEAGGSPGGSYATIAYVQGAAFASDAGTTSMSQAFSSNVTTGNLVVAAASWDTSTTSAMVCTDTRGNNYTTLYVWVDATSKQSLGICYASNITGGSDTVTVTLGGGATYRRLVVSEYSGVSATNPIDVWGGVGGMVATMATDAVTSGPFTTTTAGALIYGVVMDATSARAGITQGTGFNLRAYANNKELVTEDYQQTSPGSTAATFTFPAADRYNAALVAFKPAAN